MLKNYRIGFIVFGFMLIVSCSSTKKTSSNEQHLNTETIQEKSDNIYRLTVSFFSPGNGIDRKAKNEYINFLNANYSGLVYEETRWGREGELDFCFTLDELTEEQKVQFIQKSRELLFDSKKVHFYENKACKHK